MSGISRWEEGPQKPTRHVNPAGSEWVLARLPLSRKLPAPSINISRKGPRSF